MYVCIYTHVCIHTYSVYTILHYIIICYMLCYHSIGGEVRHGVTSGVSRETSPNRCVNTSPPQGVAREQASKLASPRASLTPWMPFSNGIL